MNERDSTSSSKRSRSYRGYVQRANHHGKVHLEAVNFIKENFNKPFFHLPHTAVHLPLVPGKNLRILVVMVLTGTG